MALAYLGLGSNLAHPRRQLARAVRALFRLHGVRIVAVSPHYASAPVGSAQPQPDYVNAVVAVETSLQPRALLHALHRLEHRQHRRREAELQRNAPRTLDIDLLLYGGRRVRSPGLSVPHPRMHERAFVLRPLIDIASAAKIPGRGLARRFLPAVRNQRIERTRAGAGPPSPGGGVVRALGRPGGADGYPQSPRGGGTRALGRPDGADGYPQSPRGGGTRALGRPGGARRAH